MTLKDIKEKKCYGRSDARTDNVKTVYPPTNTVCGGGGGGGGGGIMTGFGDLKLKIPLWLFQYL